MFLSRYLTSTSGRSPLKIGLLLDTTELPRVSAEVLEHITNTNFISIDLLVFHGVKAPATDSIWRRWRKMLFTAYDRWDRRNILTRQDPLTTVDCSKYFQGIERLDVTPAITNAGHTFPADAIAAIKAKHLDVLIHFSSATLRGDVLSSAKHGVWSYHYGDPENYRGGPPYFWETREANPISGAALQILTEEIGAGAVLYKGLFASEPGLSYRRNGLQPYWGAKTFMIQKLHQLHERGWESVEGQIAPSAPYREGRKVYRTPTNGEMTLWLGRGVARKVVNRFTQRLTVPFWRLGVRVNGRSILDSQAPGAWQEFRWATSPRGRFYADPFLIKHCGRTYVFFEDADLMTWHGSLSAAEVLASGDLAETVPVLSRPYHLSYPVMIRESSDCFMMPESLSAGGVELWRCTRFPGEWKLEKTLFTGRAVDTTLWVEDGTYWFFVTLRERYGAATQLWLFYADSLTGDWTPHPANPITTDCRRSRGAGAIFRTADGRRVRPSQDGTLGYGRRMMMNEIVTLDRDRYEERPLVTIEPPPGFSGTHTYARLDNVEIVDVRVDIPPKVLGARPPAATER